MAHSYHRHGWTRDLPDHRDHQYSATLKALQTAPASVDLRQFFHFEPYDQGDIGSCSAQAIAAAIQFDREKSKETPDFIPSRLFIYYEERKTEHSIPLDSGAQIRDGIKAAAKLGVCPETEWPYIVAAADPDTNLFPTGSVETKAPPKSAMTDAAKYKVLSYSSVPQNLSQMKACLASGYPFVGGFSVYSSLWDAAGNPKTIVPLPSHSDDPDGGHAVLIVGYTDANQMFTIRNSWGPHVQDHGHFYLPYSYLLNPNLAGDFWTIRAVAH